MTHAGAGGCFGWWHTVEGSSSWCLYCGLFLDDDGVANAVALYGPLADAIRESRDRATWA